MNNDLSKYHKSLFDHFGFNFGFVADLFELYQSNRNSVTDYWREYFDQLTSFNNESEEKELEDKSEKKSGIKLAPNYSMSPGDSLKLITGVGAKVIENMTWSLEIPIATSLRSFSVKILEENRLLINEKLLRKGQKKISFTHLIAYAVIQAVKEFPNVNNSFALIDGKPNMVNKSYINLGIAVDITRRDGTRSLIVPNIKNVGEMNFSEFNDEYNKLIEKARSGKLDPLDFQGTTLTITNPGGIGTVSSTPRLMNGQGCIIAIGAIDFPPEYKALTQNSIASLGIGKIMNISSTYDHRIIQGAESGEFLSKIDKLLLGENEFYESIFSSLHILQKPILWGQDLDSNNPFNKEAEAINKQSQIVLLINMYRVRGHLIAELNPLNQKTVYHPELDPTHFGFTIWDYDRYFISGNLQGLNSGTLREILKRVKNTYCGNIGVEYMHIQNPEEKLWLQTQMEPIENNYIFSPEWKKRIMEKLVIAEGFEHFLHTKFIGHKRFSLEGSETLIPCLDILLNDSAEENVEEIVLGMAHRGRLNVLSNVIGKSYEKIFSEFEDDIDPDSPQGTGDVKYHLGATGIYKTFSGKEIKVSISSNPSHLEFVNPVVEGIIRAKQTRNDDKERNKYLPVLIHGDGAFAGQGIVAETLNLSQLKGYGTGGTIHIIINNQIGFTTTPEEARSSPYATDVAKMIQSPIIHVNGDDPEAVLWAMRLAFMYRMKFNKDIVIDLIGYRRHGHNEGDDPVYTQPLMYKKIKEHPSVKEIYSEKTIKEKLFSPDEIENLDKMIYTRLEKSLDAEKKEGIPFSSEQSLAYSIEEKSSALRNNETKVSFEELSKIVEKITTFDASFSLNPKLKKHIEKRRKFLSGEVKTDWAFGEALAFGSILLEGKPIRLSGQDSVRGTFSQRHLVFTDINSEEEINPLNNIQEGQAKIEALDSLLSESAVLGFEYGYSITDPLALVMWEAQFGDFANGAQVIIDNFIVSSYTKWQLRNNVVLLLPHGYEGQGPEHSSARIERFLILAAEDNMRICYPTTPAQYFHLLRSQVHQANEKPLVIFTPKSLLRLPTAISEVEDFTEGKFNEIIIDKIEDADSIKNVIMTSGKIYYELKKHYDSNNIKDYLILRIEQYYPFPLEKLFKILKEYKNLENLIWVQEEPKNMGAWNFVFNKLYETVENKYTLKFAGRPESPSPASGSSKKYLKSQKEVIEKAFSY
ncbi:MAG: multifunctional oxoglutarate decarboxylase/oxoglutarate dehydrogenase thiamine pyrophosphate-binding subunit/dihydrolipoyllysine-residue succinyltransferase subunit [Melioribacteraceae bacterium]|nr:multifunctional oxoglutarate decarboxylase/oxoglutarate dehydrogenase thiamine pyrophosphate-binding subunit/dihydrolipoyllysine-residue succinyltransferase subunit [Melioribacteraceae bacterium]